MSSEAGSTKRRFGLDVLRATAILMVMVAHTLPGQAKFPFLQPFTYTCAFLGVDLFFILSGFLIGGILVKLVLEHRFSRFTDLVNFWKRRWFRTLPNYLFFLLINIALALVIEKREVLPKAFYSFFFFTQNLAWPHHPVFFTESWSLSIEEWFYLSFPMLLFFTLKLVKSPSKSLCYAVLPFFLLPPLLRYFFPATPEWGSGMQRIVIFRLDSMMFGVAAAIFAWRFPERWQKGKKLWPIGILLLIPVIAFIVAEAPFDRTPQIGRVLIFDAISICFLLLLPASHLLATPRLPIVSPIQNISLFSYSLYLCHLPLCRAMDHWLRDTWHWPFYCKPVSGFLFKWVLFFFVAGGLYRYFEKPIMDLRERSISPSKLKDSSVSASR